MRIGTDSWPWAIFHASPSLRRHKVWRYQTSDAEPSVRFPVRWTNAWQNATSSPATTRRFVMSNPIGPCHVPNQSRKPRKVRAHNLQRRREVELDDVRRLASNDADRVFVSQGLRPGFNQRSDLNFGGVGGGLPGHDRS